MNQAQLVITTCPDNGSAQMIANALIEQGLAACVQISAPVTSVYRWQGKTNSDIEQQLFIKTTNSCYPALEQRILSLHPYDLPEIITIDISGGLAPYLHWIEDNTCEN